MSKSLIAQQKMIKTPPLLVMSKIKTIGHHLLIWQYVSVTDPFLDLHHTGPQVVQKKNGRHIWPNYDIKNFFQKKFKCTPCPPFWTVTSTLVPLEHSCKKQNVGYTDATIGCSLKQPKISEIFNQLVFPLNFNRLCHPMTLIKLTAKASRLPAISTSGCLWYHAADRFLTMFTSRFTGWIMGASAVTAFLSSSITLKNTIPFPWIFSYNMKHHRSSIKKLCKKVSTQNVTLKPEVM